MAGVQIVSLSSLMDNWVYRAVHRLQAALAGLTVQTCYILIAFRGQEGFFLAPRAV